MKSPKQWVDEYSQSGPFDLVGQTIDAEELVLQIQTDAVREVILQCSEAIPEKAYGIPNNQERKNRK